METCDNDDDDDDGALEQAGVENEFSSWLTTDRTSDQPPQVGSIRQVAILAPEHAEVGRVVAEKPARRGRD